MNTKPKRHSRGRTDARKYRVVRGRKRSLPHWCWLHDHSNPCPSCERDTAAEELWERRTER